MEGFCSECRLSFLFCYITEFLIVLIFIIASWMAMVCIACLPFIVKGYFNLLHHHIYLISRLLWHDAI